MTEITRHPLHQSVLDSFAELRACPDDQHASFTAMISKILTEAFLVSDLGQQMPAFLTDEGVSILRLHSDNPDFDIPPGASVSVSEILAQWHEEKATSRPKGAIARSGRFALCEPFQSLHELMHDETILQGGLLAFVDPIYEGSLILIRMSGGARQAWRQKVEAGAILAA